MSSGLEGAAVSEGREPLVDIREAVRDLAHRLGTMGARLARVEHGAGGDPTRVAGEPLPERARRRLQWLDGALGIPPDGSPGAALDVALDRVIYGAGADCAAVFVPAADGALEPIAQRGFRGAAAPIPLGRGLVGRALAEADAFQGDARHHAVDPLLADHGLGHALAVPLGRTTGAPLGVLFAARRRAAAFDGRALAVLALVADRAGLVLERLRARPADDPDEAAPGADLDVSRDGRARGARDGASPGGAGRRRAPARRRGPPGGRCGRPAPRSGAAAARRRAVRGGAGGRPRLAGRGRRAPPDVPRRVPRRPAAARASAARR